MKKTLLVSVLCAITTLSIFAQNYQLLNSNKQYIYSDNFASAVGLEMDSIKLQGTDSLLFPSKIFLKTSLDPECFNPFASSFLGDCIIIKDNGFNNIINTEGDTIFIKTNALLNENWLAYEDDNLKIEASIYEINNLGIYGGMDSVKSIHFQVYDLEMNPLEHEINEQIFNLSKNFGVKSCSNMSLFPNVEVQYENEWVQEETIINSYSLKGQTHPAKGLQNLKWFDVYDFQVGDEFHTEVVSMNMDQNSRSYKRHVYLSREDYSDSIVYQVKQQKISVDYGTDEPLYFYHDTIKIKINKNEDFDNLPRQSIGYGGSGEYYSMTGSSNLEKFKTSSGFADYGEGCYFEEPYVGSCLTIYHYKKGLGGPYHQCDGLGGLYGSENILLYYNKGNVVWGTPVDFTVSISEKLKPFNISVYPNPVNDWVQIERASDEVLNYKVIDLSGKVILKGSLSQKKEAIDLSSMNAGVYFLIAGEHKLKIIKE